MSDNTARRRRTDRRWRLPSRRTLSVVAWVVLVAWVSLLSWSQTQRDEHQETASRAGREVACRVLNEDRAVLRQAQLDFGEVLIASSSTEPNDPLVEAFRTRLREQTAVLAERIPCDEFVDDPEKFLTSAEAGKENERDRP